MPVYNKLVRDRIPQIIEKTGKTFQTRILSEEEYMIELKEKLHEELEEYLNATNNQEAVEELADMMELINSLASIHHSSLYEIDTLRQKKAKERGGFNEKIFLIEVEDE